jgi:hypothetical protein
MLAILFVGKGEGDNRFLRKPLLVRPVLGPPELPPVVRRLV